MVKVSAAADQVSDTAVRETMILMLDEAKVKTNGFATVKSQQSNCYGPGY